MAWKFVSAALDLCQTLGYHRRRPRTERDQALRDAQEQLFWTVYGMEKGLSLRLGRSSTIRDGEITLPLDQDEPRATKLGRIHGMVYDQLYSPVGLSRSSDERSYAVESLAEDVRRIIREAHAEVAVCFQELHVPFTSLIADDRVLQASLVSVGWIRCELPTCVAIWFANIHCLV
jgi:hypothetical protein